MMAALVSGCTQARWSVADIDGNNITMNVSPPHPTFRVSVPGVRDPSEIADQADAGALAEAIRICKLSGKSNATRVTANTWNVGPSTRKQVIFLCVD